MGNPSKPRILLIILLAVLVAAIITGCEPGLNDGKSFELPGTPPPRRSPMICGPACSIIPMNSGGSWCLCTIPEAETIVRNT